ncbi:hypothetical protein P775_01655 [Puniceibacterium antarcticum]|uniref:Uncharacterized protein n=1 Tax=Puniceibacterium antarcticum TaxID=1206336 RepID=A0A2G8RL99_9RHOB|nr:hypothetical protein P775_01655 [Puniceibacterium antarcticum]
MNSSEFPLPDDMDQLKSMVRAMAAKAARADALEREIETLRARNVDTDERIKRLRHPALNLNHLFAVCRLRLQREKR